MDLPAPQEALRSSRQPETPQDPSEAVGSQADWASCGASSPLSTSMNWCAMRLVGVGALRRRLLDRRPRRQNPRVQEKQNTPRCSIDLEDLAYSLTFGGGQAAAFVEHGFG